MSTSQHTVAPPNRRMPAKTTGDIQLLTTRKVDGGEFYKIAGSPVSRQLAIAGDNHEISLWTIDQTIQQQTLTGHTDRVYAVAWSPDGKHLASASRDQTVRLWDVATATQCQQLRFEESTIYAVAWSPDGTYLATASHHNGIQIIKAQTGAVVQWLAGHQDTIYTIAWSPDSQCLVSGAADGTVRVWDWTDGCPIHVFSGHTGEILSVHWSPDGKLIASGATDKTVRLWDVQRGTLHCTLEGQPQAVTAVLFAPDGRVCLSQSSDATLRLWRCDTWSVIATLTKPHALQSSYLSTPSFLEHGAVLATPSDQNTAIQLWKLDQQQLLSRRAAAPTIHYTNAKVVLVGDTGVGKSGLGLVLAGKPFEATSSTHKRQVYSLDAQLVPMENNVQEIHEIILWDLAGQPGYRLINQLHLSDVSVALVVYDSRNEINPFAGVEHWLRALRQAQLLRSPEQPPMKIFLVAARVDRGAVGVSRARIEALMRTMHVDRHFETSAKEGWQVAELAQAIRNAIDWEALPKVSSSTLLTQIRRFLLDQQTLGQSLFNHDNLYYFFLKSAGLAHTPELRTQFNTCIDLFASRGLVEQLSFGDMTLLHPELLDAYASALVNAARREPDGLGCVLEDAALAGQFPIPPEDRLPNAGQEKILLIATVEKLLRHEIALRVRFDDVSYLVFPSQQTRDRPPEFLPEGNTVRFRFEGPVLNIYTTLIVRLAQSGLFKLKDIWKNAVEFTAVPSNSIFGLSLVEDHEGQAELRLFYGANIGEHARFQFEEYIHTHLKRRSLPNSLTRHQALNCPQCNYEIAERAIHARLQRALDWLECPICETRIAIGDQHVSSKNSSQWIDKMNQIADDQRQRATAITTVDGKRVLHTFDVFLCHNHADKAQVHQIGSQLREVGLLPWLDEWELQPGIPWQAILEDQIVHVKSVAVFVGENGIGPWQDMELAAFLRQFVSRGCPVIPIILPSCQTPPKLPVFLSGMTWVDFRITQPDPMQQLTWGITGKRNTADRDTTSSAEWRFLNSPKNVTPYR